VVAPAGRDPLLERYYLAKNNNAFAVLVESVVSALVTSHASARVPLQKRIQGAVGDDLADHAGLVAVSRSAL
jgi:hypothetical protein